jgi:glycosyltransferase involved in cell wall biosynthesis
MTLPNIASTGSTAKPRWPSTRSAVRILHVSEVIKGGVGTYLREIIALQRQTYGDESIAVMIPASQRAELPVPSGVDLRTFDDTSSRLISALRLARATYKLVVDIAPDVVHIHSTFAGAAIRPILALSRCPARIIYCPHGWAFDRDFSPLTRRCVQLVEWIWSHWCDAIVCVSNYERDAAIEIGVAEKKLFLVRNGLPKRAPEPEGISIDWPSSSRRILFVGRFDRQKGIDILFDALRELGNEAFAFIAGDSLRSSLGTLPTNARYVGWLTPRLLQAYYRSADVVVMPSRWEGFGLVALEAIRAGVPVIASRVGGLPEIVKDGITGLLIEPDDKRALAAALRSMRERIPCAMSADERRSFMDKFSIERVHRELCELYCTVDKTLVFADNFGQRPRRSH